MRKISKQNSERISVNVQSIMPEGIFISVLGNDYYVPYKRLPWFKEAKVSDILNVKMIGDFAIRWENLDVDLEIDSLKFPERYPLVMKRDINEVL